MNQLAAVEQYILLFFTYSVLGWVMEVTVKLVTQRKFINRGFLIGPLCPIYGCGMVLVTLATDWCRSSLPLTAVFVVLLCAALEYLTSFLLEKLFGARWWDYSDKPLNINGRICARTLVPFGVLGAAAIYFANPLLFRAFGLLPPAAIHTIAVVLIVLFAADEIVSLTVIRNLHFLSEKLRDNTQEISESVSKTVRRKIRLYLRLLLAYPALEHTYEILHNLGEKIVLAKGQIEQVVKAHERIELLRSRLVHSAAPCTLDTGTPDPDESPGDRCNSDSPSDGRNPDSPPPSGTGGTDNPRAASSNCTTNEAVDTAN